MPTDREDPNAAVVTAAVSSDRWKEAQAWEQEHWVRTQALRGKHFKNHIWKLLSWLGLVERHRGDDWNQWWKTAFGDYAFLPEKVENAIEVGCGPYTNIRRMVERTQIEHMVLSDPLIRTYTKFKLTFVSEMYREALCMLDDHPIEELPFASNYFDLVVMINVLDHVRDAGRCMDNLVRVTKPGGILIVGQDLTNAEDLARQKGGAGEIGHPIKLDEHWFQPWLSQGFEPLIHRVIPREECRDPAHHYGTLIFAGRKAG